ncbi:MAG: CopG family transcriptional regulator [Nitrospirota bacterium]
MPSSTRLDKETEALLKKAAECSGVTKSHLVRESIREYCARIVEQKQRTPWEIYQAVRKSDKGSGHGSRVKDGKKIMAAYLEEKRKKWSL